MDPDELRIAAAATIDQLAEHLARTAAGQVPAVTRRPPAEVAADLRLRELLRNGGLDAATFPDWLAAYLADSVNLHHAGELAHQVGVPDVPSALADVVHGVANNPVSLYEMGAAAACVEQAVIDWMLEKVGFDAHAGGVLTHGGSLANLTALLAARAHVVPSAWAEGAPHDLAVLAPRSAHYSVARAAGILGLGENAIAPLEVDALERIDVERLPAALERVRTAGRRPLALVAAACATSTGLHDDLRAIGAFCREHGIWFHVDGAHGASALLSSRHRHRLAGVELADSVIWDAHKMLRTSGLCAAVLVRRGEDLPRAFRQYAPYIEFGDAGVDAIDRQVECTKAEIGLKLFLNLAWRGEQGLAAYVDDRYEQTLRLWELLEARDGFEAPYRPESNILCFASTADPSGETLQALREELIARGEFHLSSTVVSGRRFLRVAVMSPATDETTFERLLDAVEALAVA